METPKLHKSRGRVPLSLNRRLTKRLGSPQSRASSTENAPSTATATANDCTPPHKKLSLDESLDFSPRSCEGDYSPTAFCSQTLGSESPEVTWCWTNNNNSVTDAGTKLQRFHTSSIISSEIEIANLKRTRSETSRLAYLNKRDEQRRNIEKELRKAQRARDEALLQERIAKLQEHLKNAEMRKQDTPKSTDMKKRSPCLKTNPHKNNTDTPKSSIDIKKRSPNLKTNPNKNTTAKECIADLDDVFKDCNDIEVSHSAPAKTNVEQTDSINDFFNDSDMDCLLLEATQQVELTVTGLTQRTAPAVVERSSDTNCDTTSKKPIASKSTDKRSSLYMQFLDDNDDDFFASLNDDWVQTASQANKPRSPFQRYKSMPSATSSTNSATASAHLMTSSATTAQKVVADGNVRATCLNRNLNDGRKTNPTSTTSINVIKRHASSHAIGSPSASYHGRQQHRR